MKKRVYLAAPLFNQQERTFNKEIKERLQAQYDVYLPQEDGLLLEDLLKQGMDASKAEERIFSADVRAMKESDIMLAVLDGAYIDEGVAFELGYMNAIGKQCVAIQTDIRRQLLSGNNPMINKSLNEVFTSLDQMYIWFDDINLNKAL